MSTDSQPHFSSEAGEPAWEVARLFPPQGDWSEDDFFRIHTNRMAELVDGRLEVLPVPTWLHQLIVKHLVAAIERHTAQGAGGVTLFAPLPVRLFPRTVREPDVLHVRPENVPSDPTGYPQKVDLVMEVVSGGADARRRDYEDKRADYAKAGIAEYWIVDPDQAMVTVLMLDGSVYRVATVNRSGETARSILLEGLEIHVDDILRLRQQRHS